MYSDFTSSAKYFSFAPYSNMFNLNNTLIVDLMNHCDLFSLSSYLVS